MSDDYGQVRFPDGDIKFYIYHGTVDLHGPRLVNSMDEMKELCGSKTKEASYCNCGQDENVEMATRYGGGFHRPGRACRQCMSLSRLRVDEAEEKEAMKDYFYSPPPDPEAQANHCATKGFPEWWLETAE